MALLIGQEAEGAEAEVSSAVEKAVAFTFKALKTGTITALHIKFSANGTGTKSRIAIQADEAGKPKVGVLAEGEITSNTAGEHEATGLSAEVTEGTTYWLTFLPLAGSSGSAKYKPGSTTGRRPSNVARTTIAAVEATDWLGSANKGPISIWGTGTEGGGTTVTGKATGTILLTGTAKGTAAQKVEGKATGALLLTGTAKGATKAVVTATATGALLLTGTAKGSIAGAAKGKATGALLLTGTATPTTVAHGKASGALTLTGTATATVRSVVWGQAAGAITPHVTPFITGPELLALTGTATGTTKAVIAAKATGALKLTGTAKGTATGPVTKEFLWSLAGSSTLIPTAAGETTVTYSTAAESEAIHAYAGDG